jgi:NDP-sugar pyrophosphorylase family protein
MAIGTAVLLAAGRGTRLGALTAHTPKPLLEVAGRPLIAHIAGGLVKAGLRQFIVVSGYLGEQVEQWCRGFEAATPGTVVRPVRQPELNGTGGAMLAVRPLLDAEERFIFGWGDILMDSASYPRFVDAANNVDCDLLLAVNQVDDPWRGGAVYFDSEMRVNRLIEKPERGTSTTKWNNAGLFAASSSTLFEYLERVRPSPRGELELPQAIAAMIEDGRVVRAFPISGFWSDVGTPQDLETARARFGVRATGHG